MVRVSTLAAPKLVIMPVICPTYADTMALDDIANGRQRTTFSWRILRKAFAYSSLSKRCNLCLTEKLMILSADKTTLLNRRSELISKCRHQNKLSLLSFEGTVT